MHTANNDEPMLSLIDSFKFPDVDIWEKTSGAAFPIESIKTPDNSSESPIRLEK